MSDASESDSASPDVRRTRSQTRSRSVSRRSPTNRTAAAATDGPTTAAAAATVPDADASEPSEADADGDWDSDAEHGIGEDEDDEGDESTVTGASDAAAIFSNILRRIGGESAGNAINADNITQILQQLAERGLLHQDAEGNLVMVADEDEMAAMDEDGGEAEGEDAASAMDEAKSPDDGEEVEKDDEGLKEYAQYTGLDRRYPTNILQAIEAVQQTHHVRPVSSTQYAAISAHHIPGDSPEYTTVESFEGRAFCGKFSHGSDGAESMFATATQDGKIHLFETDDWKLYKEIEARDIGWSIVDLDFSTDSRFVIYSSWSHCVHLINTQGEFELHEALDFQPNQHQQHVCMFGIRFSTNGSREILAGLNGGVAMLYDIERKRNIWSAQAHEDDINSVCWLDDSGNLFATGSDDASMRIWDRRLLANVDADPSEARSRRGYAKATPVGGFLGHVHGLTCVSAMGDGNARYVLSNSKDQSMKLWDLRRMMSPAALDAGTGDRAAQRRLMDYRMTRLTRSDVTSSAAAARQRRLDSSVVTFTGHSVSNTLIRCDFSPQHSTGFRYAFTGSADKLIYVYDMLTGAVVKRIAGHESIVRDVAWHDQLIVSTSWDHTVQRHALHEEKLHDNRPAREVRMNTRARRGRGLRRMADPDPESEEDE